MPVNPPLLTDEEVAMLLEACGDCEMLSAQLISLKQREMDPKNWTGV